MSQSRVMFNDFEIVVTDEFREELLGKARKHAAEHGETFWDMFSEKQTESKKFFLSLPREQREFLRQVATVDALMGG